VLLIITLSFSLFAQGASDKGERKRKSEFF
jgi:hypothetical protein